MSYILNILLLKNKNSLLRIFNILLKRIKEELLKRTKKEFFIIIKEKEKSLFVKRIYDNNIKTKSSKRVKRTYRLFL